MQQKKGREPMAHQRIGRWVRYSTGMRRFSLAIIPLLCLGGAWSVSVVAKGPGKPPPAATPPPPPAAPRQPTPAPAVPVAAPTDMNDLSLRVAVLELLRDWDLTPEQLKALRPLAVECAQKSARTPGKSTDALRTALTSLYGQLVQAEPDDDKVAALQDQIDDLRDDEAVDLDDEVEMTDAARRRAPDVVRLLKTGQLAAYIAAHVDEVTDPTEALVEGLDTIRESDPAEWESDRDDILDDVVTLSAGLDPAAGKTVAAQAKALLDRAHGLSDADFEAKKAELEQAAHKAVGDVSAMQSLGHWVEREVAEMLSNPQLVPAIDAMKK